MLHTHKPISDAEAKAMHERAMARAEICKRVLGEKYICHPVRQVKRKDARQIIVRLNGRTSFG